MGTTQALTESLVLGIREKLGLEAIPHFTCVGSSRHQVRDYLQALKQKGIHHVLALRGDPPAGQTQFTPPADGFAYANELVAYIRSLPGFGIADNFHIAVAAYPEGHIEAPSQEADLINLKRKVDAGAQKIITQLFFDNAKFFDFVARARAIGIAVPIIPGIMPILNYKQIARITDMCGASLPTSLASQLQACQDDAEAMVHVGIDWALAQVRELIDRGCEGIHFYMMNRARSTAAILKRL